jgi:hypothetical protein
MSFVVHIWERPAANSPSEAEAAVDALASHAFSDASPAIDALKAALLRRHGEDIDSGVDEPL